MVIAIKEVTVWDDVKRQPNHIYLMDGSKAVAYIPFGEGKPFFFKNGITLDKRGRKFEDLKDNPFESPLVDWKASLKKHVEEAEPLPFIKKVQGSKPNTWYEVNTDEHTCTCPGFTYRGKCKHIEEALNEAV